jgi:CoA:oxalate CoA-transferase
MRDRLPLEGITVIDLGQIYNGPYATFLMALAGARVIKVEPPHGDNLRGRARAKGSGVPFVMLNSNKAGVTLNLRTDRGRELLLEMADRADVLLENYRPGVTERLGIDADVVRARNPRLIYASGSGFGQTGPYRDLPAMDITVQAMSGVMSVTGWPDRPPVKTGPAICDFFGGAHLYGAVVTALYERERTGEGCEVEVSMFESVYTSLTSSLGLFFGTDDAKTLRTGNRHNGLAEAPYNAYETTDGHLTLICVTDLHWRNLTAALGREELAEREGYATRAERVERMDEMDELVGSWTRGRSTEAAIETLLAHGVPCAPVRDLAAVTTDPHLRERGMLRELDHPEVGRVTLPHSPLRFDGESGPELEPSPALGEDNEAIYCGWLGLGQGELAALEREGVV